MDIDKLQAGRELDALVAERVMGANKEQEIDLAIIDPEGVTDSFRETIWANILPHYSTSIAAAWLVVEKMITDGWDVNIEHTNMNEIEYEPLDYKWGVYFNYFTDDPKDFKHGHAETESDVPLAICLAALKAKEAE